MRSLGARSACKAMWGWCLKGDERRAVLRNEPLNIDVEAKDCKPGTTAFNRVKEAFGRYVRRIPMAFNDQGEEVLFPATVNK